LIISSIAITGSNPKDFSQTNNCGSALSGNAGCTITVNFKPTNINRRSATLTITDSAPGGVQTVALSGTGTAASLTPKSLSFAAQRVGTTSAPKTITLTNASGGTAISITSIGITGTNASDFTQTGTTCGTSLAPKQSCTVTVTFTPSATGTRSAAESFTDNAGGSPQTVPLTGTGQ
jgi:hypothetical protein